MKQQLKAYLEYMYGEGTVKSLEVVHTLTPTEEGELYHLNIEYLCGSKNEEYIKVTSNGDIFWRPIDGSGHWSPDGNLIHWKEEE